MIANAAATKAPGDGLSAMLSRTILIIAVAALLYLVGRVIVAAYQLQPWQLADNSSRLALAALVYVTGHGIRILRLALLIGGWRVGFRDIASFHLMTSAVSLAVPLKLGELYRLMELSNIAGGFLRAFVILLCTRVFDTIVVLLMLLIAFSHVSGTMTQFGGIAALSAMFLGITAIVFFIAPDNLRRLGVFIIRRYASRWTVPVLRSIDATRRAIHEAPQLLRDKVASLATLTILIWICEIACFSLAVPELGGSLNAALDALLNFLSAITRGQTFLTTLSGTDAGVLSSHLVGYLAATQLPLIILGLLASVHYVRLRFRS